MSHKQSPFISECLSALYSLMSRISYSLQRRQRSELAGTALVLHLSPGIAAIHRNPGVLVWVSIAANGLQGRKLGWHPRCLKFNLTTAPNPSPVCQVCHHCISERPGCKQNPPAEFEGKTLTVFLESVWVIKRTHKSKHRTQDVHGRCLLWGFCKPRWKGRISWCIRFLPATPRLI